jgi:ADP-ribose pyrophosphatase YjhB (NUDIX family)
MLRRQPGIAGMMQRVYRWIQPHVSMGVVGVLLDEQNEHVLLVEHLFHALHPWGLPGGWMDRGEEPARTIEREFAEETGLCIRAIYPLVVRRSPEMGAHIDVAYRCVLDGSGPQAIHLDKHELISYRWTALDDLPPMVSLHYVAIQAALQRQM